MFVAHFSLSCNFPIFFLFSLLLQWHEWQQRKLAKISVAFPLPPSRLEEDALQCFSPTTNGGMQNGTSVGECTGCIHVFERLAPICMLSRCLVTKISASELSRRFVKSALLVGVSLHPRMLLSHSLLSSHPLPLRFSLTQKHLPPPPQLANWVTPFLLSSSRPTESFTDRLSGGGAVGINILFFLHTYYLFIVD